MISASNPEESWIRRADDGQRLLVLRAELFDAIRQDLAGIFSETFAANLLYRIGISIGRASHDAMKNKTSSEKDFWQILQEHLKERGLGKLIHHDTSTEASKVRVTFSVDESAFAEGLTSSRPLCDVLRGALGEWISLHYGRKLLSSSESCKTSGSRYCIFSIELGPEKSRK